MAYNEKFAIVFHGTSSFFDSSIQDRGFLARPVTKLSEKLSLNDKVNDHLISFDGTYVAIDRDVSRYYAKEATNIFGGEPRIYVLRVPLSSMVPDEDEVHFALSCNLAAALGFEEDTTDYENQYATQPWSIDVARDAVQGIAEGFGMDAEAIDQATQHLHSMIAPTIVDWDLNLFFFHPEGNDQGWSSPNWVRKLTSLEGGFDLYRDRMDAFLACMKGASPMTCPAGFSAFKGRITETFKFNDNENGVTVIGYGSPDNPFEHFVELSSVSGDEMILEPEMLNPSPAPL